MTVPSGCEHIAAERDRLAAQCEALAGALNELDANCENRQDEPFVAYVRKTARSALAAAAKGGRS